MEEIHLKRPQRKLQKHAQIGEAERLRAASNAVYVGSPEHKHPTQRSDASLCPRELKAALETITGWLREAIQRGDVGGEVQGGFPRYVWSRQGSQWFEGRLTNPDQGWYKGYPVEPYEVPPQLRDRRSHGR